MICGNPTARTLLFPLPRGGGAVLGERGSLDRNSREPSATNLN